VRPTDDESRRPRGRRRWTAVTALAVASLALTPGAMAALINGTNGNDELRGTRHGDKIDARAGNDVVRSLRGGDVVHGGPGKDRIETGYGDDEAWGGRGDDELRGGPGSDYLSGAGSQSYRAADKDVAYGGPGRDTLIAATMYGGDGADRLWLYGPGTDVANGGRGNDRIFTDEDEDPLVRDVIRCGPGYDRVEYWDAVDPNDVLIGCEELLFSHAGD
jgi:Ca2+-binding RTX toxin-like protein